MIRLRGTIIYDGGRREDFRAGPTAIADWELYAHRHNLPLTVEDAPRMLFTLYVAYAALGVAEGFDVWRKSVEDVDLDLSEVEVPPTLPAPTGAP